MILVTGFGPFGEVTDNPSGALAMAVHGARVAGHTVVGVELPVSYSRGLAAAVRAAREAPCDAVIGVGVATSRERVEVERFGHNRTGPTPDIDGEVPGVLEPGGPARFESSLPAGALAAALGAAVSEDAGGYVCNGWLYRVGRALPGIPVCFVHIPPAGMAAERLLGGLRGWLVSGSPR